MTLLRVLVYSFECNACGAPSGEFLASDFRPLTGRILGSGRNGISAAMAEARGLGWELGAIGCDLCPACVRARDSNLLPGVVSSSHACD